MTGKMFNIFKTNENIQKMLIIQQKNLLDLEMSLQDQIDIPLY